MRVSILSTGEEILRGEVLDTNAAFASALLDENGFDLGRRYTCGDSLDELTSAIRTALDEAEVLICCGGLGPTVDDRTLEAVATALGRPLQQDPELARAIEARFTAAGMPFTANQLRQARLPQDGLALDNPNGTAPGIACQAGEQWVFCLPGPPREFRPMLRDSVLPRLLTARRDRGVEEALASRVLKVFGRGEGWLGDQLSDLEAEVPGLVLGFRATMPEIHVKLRTRQPTRAQAVALLDRAEALVRDRLGQLVYGSADQTLAAVTLDLLIGQGLSLAVAESCTGGLVGKLLTDVPGSSAAFLLSAVTYSDQAKQSVLGLAPDLLAGHGAVSEACARAMAEGVRRLAGADLAVAITGISGPGGGSPDKPVGTTWFATAGADGTFARLKQFPAFDRDGLRSLAAHSALDLIRRRLLERAGNGRG